ncbi:chaperone protein dnaJ 11, chloroplastic-like [Neltuma alba]|uniref:chaperone protein dnaJ 11, chloroplastic-like n=1 Tax=Neltuma alba TaxID=207710 RepID=UPI0010A2D450|nr:chaperone protein dnaJ 11, chloroplastic-like [Prosopis alba]XP_028775246.1 chaperone protein dnaJ 11, chloroplastic-like [Prosopis alba]
MLPLSRPAPLSAPGFSGNSVYSSSPPSPHRVPIRPIVASATATESCSAWTEQPRSRSSYLTSHTMSSCTSLYDILGIPAGASHQEIKAAYRRLARVCHPDVAAVDRKDSSADAFMKIHAAYSTLSDPEKRASYDRSLFVRRQRPLSTASSASSYSGYSGRNWETDQCW